MKKIFKPLPLLVLWALSLAAYGQADTSSCRSFSFGVSAGELGEDSGIGIEVSSPTFCNERLCIRLKGNVMWLEQYKSVYDHWVPYRSVGISFAYNFKVIERSRVFLDFGPYMIFPDTKFSDVRAIEGVNCSIGVEIFLINTPTLRWAYYFSGGIAHLHARAEKLEHTPQYGDGFIFNNGFRIYLPTCRN